MSEELKASLSVEITNDSPGNQPPNVRSPTEGQELPVNMDAPEEKDASHISENEEGVEEVIYPPENNKAPLVPFIRPLLNYMSMALTVYGVGYIFMGRAFVSMYQSKNPDFTHIFFYCTVLNIARLFIEAAFAFSGTAVSAMHKANALAAVSWVIVFHSFLFYFAGIYSQKSFLGLLSANIVYQLFKKYFSANDFKSIIELIFNLIESVSILFIGLKISQPSTDAQWSYILAFYTVVYYMACVTAIFMAIGLVILLLLKLFHTQIAVKLSFEVLFGVFIFSLLLAGLIASTCSIYLGVRKMLEQNMIQPPPVDPAEIPIEILDAGDLLTACGVFLLVVIAIFNLCYRKAIMRYFAGTSGNEITVKKYIKAFHVELQAISPSVFKRKSKVAGDLESDGRDASSTVPQESCLVCRTNPSSVLLMPCGHCVLCSDCTVSFLQSNKNCPICATVIDRCYHIKYEENVNKYKVDQSYIIRRV